MYPALHLNGTSAERLREAACDAGQAARALLAALGEAAPNGRDYYPQGPDAYGRAAREHDDRLRVVGDVLADLKRLAEHAADCPRGECPHTGAHKEVIS